VSSCLLFCHQQFSNGVSVCQAVYYFVINSLIMGYQCVKLSIILSSTVW